MAQTVMKSKALLLGAILVALPVAEVFVVSQTMVGTVDPGELRIIFVTMFRLAFAQVIKFAARALTREETSSV